MAPQPVQLFMLRFVHMAQCFVLVSSVMVAVSSSWQALGAVDISWGYIVVDEAFIQKKYLRARGGGHTPAVHLHSVRGTV
jgi:hypothetical protein